MEWQGAGKQWVRARRSCVALRCVALRAGAYAEIGRSQRPSADAAANIHSLTPNTAKCLP